MISHIQLNVRDLDASVRFYLATLSPLGFARADSGPGYVRLTNGRDCVIVLCPTADAFRTLPYHRKAAGLGHFALTAESRELVESMAGHLATLNIPLLGHGIVDGDYRGGYYTISFEDPDRVMIEIVHHDPYYFRLSAT